MTATELVQEVGQERVASRERRRENEVDEAGDNVSVWEEAQCLILSEEAGSANMHFLDADVRRLWPW